ncbi:ABC transporter substrate-binding protein [Caminicella sporogenes]|uniref:ABC transporter substrate-binding protein n=1 Tax=Caminicella sporogenes TaxID=166485 RepID=UPI00254179E6|nr:ABC transporter substrate-binding protein [Caminicella sporogenes]WIF94006.1 ABC transporter substrate-binding protein [Caminicella sporogenes]
MKKIISLSLILTLFALVFTGCLPASENTKPDEEKQEKNVVDEKENEKITLKVAAPSGPTTVSLIKMFKDKPSLGNNIEVIYESVKSPDLLAAKIISGEVDFAVVPTNLAAKLYNKGVPYKLAAPTIWGVLYVAGTENVEKWNDLKNKEVVTIGRGLTPDILFRYLLSKNGLNPDEDLKLNYLSSPQELAQTMIAEKNTIGIIPEPMLTTVLMKNKDIKIYIDMQKEWKKITGYESYPQSSLIIKNEVLEKHPKVVDKFLTEYENSIKWVNDNPDKAGTYVEDLNIGLNAKIVEKAIPRSNIKYVDASNAKSAIREYLKVLFDFSPKSIGGKLPEDEFYFER